ncbi:FAD-dependent oxidoreductase, partial [Bacteriovoracaceae bacterium]|nr:FAD-dependent oxidoreductase [Bacteriovoracaceae bacterium]
EAYNLVGFQTRLTFKEQKRVFRMIPGFDNATFLHMGSVHRNTFLNSKKLLNHDLSTKKFPELYFAGQIVGVEGYTESAACGLYVANQIWRKISGEAFIPWPNEMAIGALLNYIMTADEPAPKNINGGLFPIVSTPQKEIRGPDKKQLKRLLITQRANATAKTFLHLTNA